MEKRTTKIFINSKDTVFDNNVQFKDTVSGYLIVTLHSNFTTESLSTQYYINTARPQKDQLGVWGDRFDGTLSSYRKYAKICDGVKIAAGNIVKPINNGTGRKFVACFIAVFNNDKIYFNIHYPTEIGVFYVDDVIIGKNMHDQYETDMLDVQDGNGDISEVFQPISVVKKHGSSALTYIQESEVLHRLQLAEQGGEHKKQNSQKLIAESMNVTQPVISKLKARFKKEGLL